MKAWLNYWKGPLIVVVIGLPLLFAQVQYLRYDLFIRGCTFGNSSLENAIFCKRVAKSWITPGKPDVHFNGVTLKWLDNADRYVNEKQFEEWKDK